MLHKLYENYENRKRTVEFLLVILVSAVLLAISRLETRLFTLSESFSENKEFFTSLVYFAIINVNVILALFLGFLLFRNIIKLIIERRKGVFGSKLRTKLVVSFAFFALAPTLLLFYVSTKFITRSFETWFSEKVKESMQLTREAGSSVYEHDQKRLESLARIALRRVETASLLNTPWSTVVSLEPKELQGFGHEYGLQVVKIYKANGEPFWSSTQGYQSWGPGKEDTTVEEALQFFIQNPDSLSFSRVVGENQQDVVKGFAPIRDPVQHRLLGMVITEVRFETRILESIEKIIADFGNLKPGAQLIQMSYTILMVVMTLLIVFSATWLGFYVAREISGPLQRLAEAAGEVSQGNYHIMLESQRTDEAGLLVQAFNRMTQDLRAHQSKNEEAQKSLQKTNEELERRRQYMEIVLKNISAGVLSVDANQCITSVNSAAEKLLHVQAKAIIGGKASQVLPPQLLEFFWNPISEALQEQAHYHGQIELESRGEEQSLLVDATKIYEDNQAELGAVLVFGDATLQVMTQRAAAWREVARRIAHEIKNPITPIKLSAQRLLRRFHDRFEKEELDVFKTCIETIITQVDALRNLVNEFSNFSRLPTIHPQLAKASDVLLEVVKFFELGYPEVKFDYQNLQAVPSSLLDREQLNRAFVNLLTNSITALLPERKGKITVSCRYVREMKTIRIEIIDNGCGIPVKLRERVLEPYFSTKEQGSGLGLAIVNQIVIDHQGYLRLGENHTHGTRVSIELPV